MKHLMMTLMTAGLTLVAGAAQQGTLSDGVYTISVADGESVTLNSDDVTALGADNTLLKTGTGTLIISCDLGKTYDGEIIVREGFLRATCGASSSTSRGLGGTTKGTIIENGATLEMVRASNENECANREPITFEGSGVNGCGAIYNYSNGNTGFGLFAESTITMTGDATVGSKTRSDGWFRIRNTAINMQKYNLTFQNSDTANGFKGGSNSGPVTNPGNIIVAEGACFCLENANSKIATGDSTHKIILNAKSTFRQATAVGARCGWTLQVDGAAKIMQDSGVTSGYFGWEGPIVLNDTLTIASVNTSYPLVFNGAISGTGALVYSGSGKTKMNGNSTRVNTYTGGTTFKANCNVIVAAPGLIPTSAGALTSEAGSNVLVQPQSASDYAFFTADAVFEISRALAAGADRAANVFITGSGSSWPSFFSDTEAVVGGESSSEATLYSGCITNAEMQLTGTMSRFVNVAVRPSTTMRLNANNATEGWVEVNGGTLILPSDVTLTVSNRVYVGGANASHIGRLKVEGTLNFNNANAGGISASSQALKANVRATECGVVEIAAGATVNGCLGLNQGGCTDGAVQKTAATGVYVVKGTVNAPAEAFIGDFRSEYYEIASGGVLNTGLMRLGRGTGSYANLRVKSGASVRYEESSGQNAIRLAYNGGQTDLLVDGGRLAVLNGGFVMNCAEKNQTGGYSSFTVCDNGEARFQTPVSGAGWVDACINSCTNSTGYLNLIDGGLLEASTINRANKRGARCFVSFDGGTYAMRYNTSDAYKWQRCFYRFAEGEGTNGDHVVIFSKGATISNDTPTYVGVPLEAPTGKGIEAIALPDEIASKAAWAIPSAPMVRITDATGCGATAVALYDAENGKVTGIKVTSRGINYTAPTVTLSKGGLSSSLSFTDCCTLTDNVSGGLVKTGSGVLYVTNTMTYTGTTIVRQGTLKPIYCDSDHVLDSSTNIIVESGATLDLNGYTYAHTITGCGAVTGNITLPQDWTVDADVLNAATTSLTATGDVTIPSGTTVTVAHADKLDLSKRYILVQAKGALNGDCPSLVCANDRAWKLKKVGKKLLLFFERGTVVVFR